MNHRVRRVVVPNGARTTGLQLQLGDNLGGNAQKWLIQTP
jgi:hypothetical protein